MNLLYNSADGVILISSNEGWGLSITEALMCGKPVIGNVTGGIQDQARFEDGSGDWIEFDDSFMSNHLKGIVPCGEWFFPVWPSNISIQGSPLTPYITDERSSPIDVADVIRDMYIVGSDFRRVLGLMGREWVTSDESGMSAKNMCKNVMTSIDHVFSKWEPRESVEIIKVEKRKKKSVKYPISQ